MSETLITPKAKLKAFPLYMGSSGCDYHRVKLPFLYGGQHYDEAVHEGFEPSKLLEYMGASDVVVYNRHFALQLVVLNQLRDQYGFKIIVDLDDWIVLPDYHPMYKQYKFGDAARIIENLRNADMVTVTTDRLYQKVKEFNSNTHVIPNALPFGHGQFTVTQQYERSEPFNFIYTGQASHLEDVRLMQSEIGKIRKLDISLTLAGFSKNSPAVWNKIESVFKPIPNYIRQEMLPLGEYMSVYDSANCSVVPLCFNEFNSCKSNLKLLEAGAKKVPCIVSYVPPYRDDVDAPVLWVKEPGDWYKHMKYLSENKSVAAEMGEALHEYVKERYDLFKWNKVRFELYDTLR